MKVELDGTALDQTEESPVGGISEARSIVSIVSAAKRNYILHAVPGLDGCIVQDLGRTAVRIQFDGTIMGKSAISVIEMLRSRYKSGTPVPFVSDISGSSDITRVIIDDFKVTGEAGNKNKYSYTITLREYNESG